jgi:hypothetical protein
VVAGFFLFFIFFGLSMLLFQLVFEAIAIAYHIRTQSQLRRLRYFVELSLCAALWSCRP